MSAGVTEIIDLDIRGADGARDAADALQELNDKIVADKKELQALASAMGNLKGGGEATKEQAKKLGEQFGALKKRVAENSKSYIEQGGALDKLGKATKDAGDKGKEASGKSSLFERAIGKLGLSLKQNEDGTSSVTGGWKMLGGAAAAGAAAAIAATVAIGAATAALIGYGIAAADAARTTRIQIAAWMGSVQQGAALQSHIDKLARSTPIAKEAITQYALGLQQAGLEGKGLTEALRAVTKVAGTLGAGAAGKLEAIAQKAKQAKRFMANALDFQGSGLRIDEVAAELAKSLKISMSAAKSAIQDGRVKVEDGLKAMADAATKRVAPFEKELGLSLPAIAQKAKEGLSDLFSGIKIEGILGLLKEMVGLLDKNTATGQALRGMLSGIFGPLDKSAKESTPQVIAALQNVVLGALKVENFVLKCRKAWKNAFGSEAEGQISIVTTALNLLLAAGVAVGVAIGAAAAPFIAFFAAMNAVENATRSATKYLQDLDWGSIGSDLIDGFVKGIKDGLDRVTSAASSVGSAAEKAMRAALDSKSPSRKMIKLARYDVAGAVAIGLDQGTPEVARSAKQLGTATVAGVGQGAKASNDNAKAFGAGSKQGGPGINITFGPGSIVLGGSALNEGDVAMLMTRALEKALQSQGLMGAVRVG